MREVSLVEQERFWSKVEKEPSNCWIFTGAKRNGYGLVYLSDGREGAHRVSLLIAGVDVQGKEIHHKCERRACVNPEHLLVTAGRSEHQRLHARWERDDVIVAIRAFHSLRDRPPSVIDFHPSLARSRGYVDRAEFFEKHEWPRVKTAVRLFGSWADAVEAAGLPRPCSGRHIGVTSLHGRADAIRLIRAVAAAPRVRVPV